MAELEKQIDSFGRMIERLGFLGDSRLKDRIFLRWKKETEKLIKQGFDTEQDPSGRSWRPLADSTIQKKGHDRILYDTGAMRQSYRVYVLENGVQIRSLVPYSSYHQTGARSGAWRLPKRRTLPDRGLETWRETLVSAARDEVRKAFLPRFR